MSETSNGMPDLSTGDSEPSMEDILASIRQIIADDKTESLNVEPQSEGSEGVDALDVSETTSFSQKVEEQQFEIPEIEGASQEFDDLTSSVDETAEMLVDVEDEEILDLINFAQEDEAEPEANLSAFTESDSEEPESAFDESLDLVMDSDASDYYSSSAESNENRLLREEIENELSVDEGVFEPAGSIDENSDMLGTLEDTFEAPGLDDMVGADLSEQQDILTADDEQSDDLLSEFEDLVGSDSVVETEEPVEDTIAEIDEFEALNEAMVEADDVSGEDQDMDLVKSLLADLMDEEDTAEFDDEVSDGSEDDVFESFADVLDDDETASLNESEADNILDEILYQSMEDETALTELTEIADEQDESELAEIARTAREAAATPYEGSDNIRAEDKVELPARKLDKRLNLSAAGGFVGVAAGAAIAGAGGESSDKDLDAAVTQLVEEELELEEIEELLDLIEETETETVETTDDQIDPDQAALEELVEELESPQEDEDMGRAAKKEALVDEDIEQESTEAFAALSHVVQEKAEMEENGPPIGDLVQDALRPMLKDWLDKNLKGIVERAVTKEVKRISSGK